MTTARDVVTRALKRMGLIASDRTPSAQDASDTLDGLNEMLAMWAANGVNTLAEPFGLDDAFVFFVPPEKLYSTTLDMLVLAGDWDASGNSPALASGYGAEGTVYRVTTAGTSSLDGLAAWAVDDYAVLGRRIDASGKAPTSLYWQKGMSSGRHLGGTIALLAKRMASEFGSKLAPEVAEAADSGWRTLLSDYTRAPNASFDPALTRLPSRRWPYSIPSSDLT